MSGRTEAVRMAFMVPAEEAEFVADMLAEFGCTPTSVGRGRPRKWWDADEIAEMYRAGVTLSAMGKEFGVTRERIRQILADHLGKDGMAAAKEQNIAVHAAAARATREVAQLAKLLRRIESARPCVVCKSWVLRGESRSTCSSECARVWVTGGRLQTPEGHHAHRLAVARTILREPTTNRPSKVAWAKRMLSDDPPPPNRRFIVPGSKASRARAVVDPRVDLSPRPGSFPCAAIGVRTGEPCKRTATEDGGMCYLHDGTWAEKLHASKQVAS